MDNLAINFDSNTNDGIISLLNDLYQRSFYKWLHLRSSYYHPLDRLPTLHGLVALCIPCARNIGTPVLTNIKELGIYRVPANVTIDDMNACFIFCPNFNAILSFIRHSPNLRSVEIWGFQGNVVDISALNNERKKLDVAREKLGGARKVTLHVGEDVYIATKWTMVKTMFDMIEMKPKTSRNVIRTNNFLCW